MKLTLEVVKENPQIQDFIKQTERYMDSLGYTDHGFRHVNIVSDRSRSVLRKAGFSEHEQELAAIAGYCHDMGNFLGRSMHHYWGAMLFSQVFMHQVDNPTDVSTVALAIANHDKYESKLTTPITAALILADKSDVHRSRVKKTKGTNMKKDIHDRVNYAVMDSDLTVQAKNKLITLRIKLDTKASAPLEYFEVFTERMTYCRVAAEYLGYKFGLEINKFKLL